MAAHATLCTLAIILLATVAARSSHGTARSKWFSEDSGAATLSRVRRQTVAGDAPHHIFMVKLNVVQAYVPEFKNNTSAEFAGMQNAVETLLGSALKPVVGKTIVTLEKIRKEDSTHVKLVCRVTHQSRTPMETELRSTVKNLHNLNPPGALTVGEGGYAIVLKKECEGGFKCSNGDCRLDEAECVSAAILAASTATTAAAIASTSTFTTPDSKRCPGDAKHKCVNSTIEICKEQLCDVTDDCGDGSDELNCDCISHLLCSDQITCISEHQKCDGMEDCPDGSDEDPNECPCPDNERHCLPDSPHECIQSNFFCDGKPECSNAYDESEKACGCQILTQFQCVLDRNCIDGSLKCNKIEDCADRSDEKNCPIDCMPNAEFLCDGSLCLPNEKLCDKTGDCNDGFDELNCASSPLPESSTPGSTSKPTLTSSSSATLSTTSSYSSTDSSFATSSPPSTSTSPAVSTPPSSSSSEALSSSESTSSSVAATTPPSTSSTPLVSSPLSSSSSVAATSPPSASTSSPVSSPPSSSSSMAATSPPSTSISPTASSPSSSSSSVTAMSPPSTSTSPAVSSPLSSSSSVAATSPPSASTSPAVSSPKSSSSSMAATSSSSTSTSPTVSSPSSSSSSVAATSPQTPGTSVASSVTPPATTPRLPGCDRGFWLCDDLVECVLVPLVCDGTPHCKDGSDETKCRECAAYEKMCQDRNTCIPEDLWCDGRPHCPDQSDEANCIGGCERGFWLCDDLVECVPVSSVCDGTPHCKDLSDEMKCRECLANEKKCRNGDTCIPESLWCDGRPHCPDRSDEADCNGGCNRGFWLCDDAVTCIAISSVCDGAVQCPDGSDERRCRVCASNERQCNGSDTCIPERLWCDGHRHCPDGSDETDCSQEKCTGQQWRCGSGECINALQRCNLATDCRDGSDEQGCSETRCSLGQWMCSDGRTCINATTVCDSADNCPDGSDEKNCPRCPEGYWQCQDRLCVLKDVVCDGSPDCLDDSDEQFCPSSCPEGRWMCSDRRACIPPFLWCDGVPNCFDGSDEEYCAECRPDQWKCKDLACIPASHRCDGALHCPDGSDEDGCHAPPRCSPYEFQCRSGGCILQYWMCDGSIDCSDGSDERECGPPVPEPGELCRMDRFACHITETCIPRSLHCDGEVDCLDQSDELGCQSPKFVEIPPVTLEVRVHSDLILRCRAEGVPVPTIVWRWNAVHVPSKCTQSSAGGVGVLSCPDIRPVDQGSFTSEAYNSWGSILAVPATFVNVKGDVSACLPPFFNAGATDPRSCLPCFCFEATSTCYSTERHVAEMDAPSPASFTPMTVLVDPFRGLWTVMDYSPLHDDGSVVPIETVLESPYPEVQYYALPDSHRGNQLLSYGGTLRYTLRLGAPLAVAQQAPDVIIKGNDITLVHVSEVTILPLRDNGLYVQLAPGQWFRFARPYTSRIEGHQPASREEIMTALQDVQQILIRAQWDPRPGSPNAMVFNVVMNTASTTGSSFGRAMLVEECRCPTGYNGTSCDTCSEGYRRVGREGSRYGECILDSVCRPGEYGGEELNMPCLPCPCPLTGAANNFGRGCFLGPDRQVTCSCPPGYVGRNCERCASGYNGIPTVPGGSCQPVWG